MADNAPPRMISRQLFRGAAPAHIPRSSGGGIPQINRQGMKAGSTQSGLARSFGASAGARTAGSQDDPAVSGAFSHNPTTMWGPFKLGGGDLTDKGKSDKADYDVLRQGQQDYLTLKNHGASPQEAAQAAVRAGGVPLLMAMQNHPSSPLNSVDAFHQLLGGGEGPTPVGLNKSGSQVLQRDAQGNLSYSNIPGYVPDPGKTTLVKTDTGYMNRSADGTLTPALGPGGDQAQPPLSAAQQKAAVAANQPLTEYSKDPVPTSASKHPLTNDQSRYLSNAPNFINDLKVARDYADAAGPVSGMVNYVGGKYLGLNAEGATYAAALNRLDQGVYAQYGVKGSAGAKQLMATLPTHNEAPSYVQAAITGQIENEQRELQSMADVVEKQSGPLPGTVSAQLQSKADVYPLSVQSNASPSWVARNFPDQLTPAMASTLAQRSDLEPSEVSGLNAKLDKVQARRMQDYQTQGQPARPPSIATPSAPAPSPVQQEGQDNAGASKPPTQQPAQGGQQPTPSQPPPSGSGNGVTPPSGAQPGQQSSDQSTPPMTSASSGAPVDPAQPPPSMPGDQTTPATTPAPPALPPPLATLAPGANPYAAAAVESMGGPGGF